MEKRYEYIDIAKGLGMFAIVWGHICCKGWSNCLVYSFHIPLFFFLSGMMFDENKYPNFLPFIAKRAKRLLIPYVVYSVITWIIWALFSMLVHRPVESYLNPLLQTIVAKGSGGFLVHNVALWFIPCLLAVEIIYYVLAKYKLGGVVLSFIIAWSSMYLASIYGDDYNHFWPWNLDSAFVALPFYAVGHQITKRLGLRRLQEFAENNKPMVFSACILLTVVLCYLAIRYGAISMGHSQFGNEYVFHLRAFIGCASTILFSLWLSCIDVAKQVINYISWFGRNSFDVMATNNPIKGVVCTIIAVILHVKVNDASFTDIPHSMIAFAITMVIDSILVIYILRIKRIWKKLLTTFSAMQQQPKS